MATHLVWDWNGTLLNDFDAVVHASNEALIAFGGSGLDAETHRRRFRRPLAAFYGERLGRTMSEPEFNRLNELFNAVYREQLPQCKLSDGAREAMASWEGTQSLLSMSNHDDLVPLVTGYGLLDLFSRVDGLREPTDIGKHRYLVNHLKELNTAASDVVMIGDSLDDAAAAVEAGAACVLVSGGTTAVDLLEASGHPVAHSLTDAVALAKAA
ncbi:MAG TPA: HAD hydrolase-like protein [Candidatus Stackebrandtia excrementipullorum]|nr:HAD hydrolase-like protein [Candidatus Stackebrandtia excrementipullorum]